MSHVEILAPRNHYDIAKVLTLFGRKRWHGKCTTYWTTMITSKTRAAAILAVCLAGPCFAADESGNRAGSQPQAAATAASGTTPLVKRVAAGASAAPVAVNSNSEVFVSVVVEAGQTYSLESTLDYSSAATVAVAVECLACSTSNMSLGPLGLVLQARWAVPGASLWVATESKAGTAFAYWDAGAALFNVYGSLFQLVLQNKGNQTITLDQVTFFLHSQ